MRTISNVRPFRQNISAVNGSKLRISSCHASAILRKYTAMERFAMTHHAALARSTATVPLSTTEIRGDVYKRQALQWVLVPLVVSAVKRERCL